ncbi:MAG TPA: MFS transporter, partial [Methanomicrobiales archaeon]|nr:MFS transporter [Methanomicrobiales archaeon]
MALKDLLHVNLLYIAIGIAAIGGILFGYDTGVISGAILFIRQDFSLSASGQELAVSAVLIGAIIGALLGGPLADRLGRRITIVTASAIFLIGTAVVVFSYNLPIFIGGRILIGIAIGIASFTTPLYISEITPKNIRGSMVSINQLFLTSGILVSYGVDYYFAATGNWQAMFAIGAIPASVLLIGMYLLP